MNGSSILAVGKTSVRSNQKPIGGSEFRPAGAAFKDLMNAAMERTLGNTGKPVHVEDSDSGGEEKPQPFQSAATAGRIRIGPRIRQQAENASDSEDSSGDAASAQAALSIPAQITVITELPPESEADNTLVVDAGISALPAGGGFPVTGEEAVQTQATDNFAAQGGVTPEENADNTGVSDQLNITGAEGTRQDTELPQTEGTPENDQENMINNQGAPQNEGVNQAAQSDEGYEPVPDETDGFAGLIEDATKQLSDTIAQKNTGDLALELRNQAHNARFEEELRRESGINPESENDVPRFKEQTVETKRRAGTDENVYTAQLSANNAVRGGTPMQREEVVVKASSLPQQAEQIQAEVIRNIENQKMEFRLQLQPENLGQIDVKMALEGGKLMIEIISSSKTSELLSRQTDALVSTLRQNSPELSSVQVVNETHSAGTATFGNLNGFQNRQDSEGGSSGHTQSHNRESSVEMETDENISAKSDKILDYMI